MSEARDLPEDPIDLTVEGAHLVGRVQTGHAISDVTGDIVVVLILWAHDIPKPGVFAMEPRQARLLAEALLDSAQEAENR